jgi:hypothetical protein
MKKLTLSCLVLSFLVLPVAPVLAAPDEAPAAPGAEILPEEGSTPCDAPDMSVDPSADAALDSLGLPVKPLAVHGTCGPVQNECRSCAQGVKSCDYKICYTSGSGFHKDTIYCTPCGNFC